MNTYSKYITRFKLYVLRYTLRLRLIGMIWGLAALLAFNSCTAPIDINTDDSDPVLVTYGTLTDEMKNQEIILSNSSPYFQDKPNEPIIGATVTVDGPDNRKYDLFEVDTIPGLYRSSSPWAVTPGKTYNLNIDVDFNGDGINDNFKAATTIAAKVTLDSIKLVPMTIMGHKNFALNIYVMDPPGDDYYLFKYYVNDTLVTPKISQYRVYNDLGINGQYLNGLTVDYLDHIDNWETDSETQRKYSIYIKPGDILTVEHSKITKGYFDFISHCQKEMNGENPIFGGPASNIATNIPGGAGYFTGFCTSKISVKVK